MAMQMSDDIMEIAAAGVRQRHPGHTDEQVRLAVIRMRLGDKLFREVYGTSIDI
jgi:hypothetical protein